MWFFEDSFFQHYIEPINQVGGQGAGGQAKQAIGKRGVGKRRDCDVHRYPGYMHSCRK